MQHITLIDDTQYARIELGPSFSPDDSKQQSGFEGLKHLVESVPSEPGHAWKLPVFLLGLNLERHQEDDAIWELGYEESVTYPKRFRAILQRKGHPYNFTVEILDSFELRLSHDDMADRLPESLYGALIGFAAGATEAKKYTLEAFSRSDEGKIQTWRAPRFSFSFRTAAGSPFGEKWAFAVQESAAGEKQFRAWIEQQRTGREFVLAYDPLHGFAGLEKIETLPAGVHGAALGMALGMYVACHRLKFAAEEGELEEGQYSGKRPQLKCFMQENREEAEAVLQEYVDSIRTTKDRTAG